MLQPGVNVIADNTLNPGAPLWLWDLAGTSTYRTHIVRVSEFVEGGDDWMSISVRQLLAPTLENAVRPFKVCLQSVPHLLEQANQRSDEVRRKSLNPGMINVERRAHGLVMRAWLAHLSIAPTVDALGGDECALTRTLSLFTLHDHWQPTPQVAACGAALGACLGGWQYSIL